jgi:DNA-binding MarR family transcriptional regulator
MTDAHWTSPQLDGFHKAAQSLKLYRRAELQDEDTGSPLIEELYVDPLPNSHVLQTTLKPNTTFLIGRKGSGKSTVFQRAQHELRKSSSSVSVYIDIKTIFESSQVDPSLIAQVQTVSTSTIPIETLKRLLLYKTFLKATIGDIQSELKKRIRNSFWQRIKLTFLGSVDDLFEDLDDLLEEADTDKFMSILGIKQVNVKTKTESGEEKGIEGAISGSLGMVPGFSTSATAKDMISHASGEEHGYSDVLIRIFNIKDFLLHLKELLAKISIKRLYVFVDDFSELPEDAMRIVVDTLLAPLNNWSEELIKFKIAAYPSRVYYGSIDKTKIDEINLDLYKLYGASDVTVMEEKAIDFTKRIVARRIEKYCKCSPDVFLSDRQDEDVWRTLFYATMANPRNLGYLLFYLYESNLIYGRPIGLRTIRDVARKYYEEKIEPYFAMNRFLHESFDERSSVFSLKELLEKLVMRSRELRGHRGSQVMTELSELSGRPPTSHFHVLVDIESLLSSLELNFFITRYFEMSDRDGRKVAVFALNYGLCQKYAIEFGRPKGKRQYRLYFVERVFDYTPILLDYMKANQEVVCETCSERYGIEQIPALQLYGMQCPRCKVGFCKVINLSRKYEKLLQSIEPDLLLPKTELGILQTLKTEKDALYARQIAEELDCSYQLIGKRGKILKQRGLVNRKPDEQGRPKFSITDAANQLYFNRDEYRDLDLASLDEL